MALSSFVGSFTTPAATGNKAVTGIGFQPKMVIFFGNRQNADGATAVANNQDAGHYLGFGVSSSSRACHWDNDDNSGGGGNIDTTKVIRNAANNSGLLTTYFAADLVSLDADGFTVNFMTANATAYIVGFMALGGSDLTNVGITSFSAQNTTGNQAVTGVGFKPDSVFFLTTESSLSDPGFLGGFATSSTKCGSTAYMYNGSVDVVERTDRCIHTSNATVTSVPLRSADLVSLDSDGFTLNWSVAASSVTTYAICFKGGSFSAGSMLQKTSTGTKAVTGVGFVPTGVLFLSNMNVASSAIDGTTRMALMVSALSDASHAFTFNWADSFNGTALAALASTKAWSMRDNAVPPNLVSEAVLSTFDADGFTLNFGTADATAREAIFLVFGSVSGATSQPIFRQQTRPFPFTPGGLSPR